MINELSIDDKKFCSLSMIANKFCGLQLLIDVTKYSWMPLITHWSNSLLILLMLSITIDYSSFYSHDCMSGYNNGKLLHHMLFLAFCQVAQHLTSTYQPQALGFNTFIVLHLISWAFCQSLKIDYLDTWCPYSPARKLANDWHNSKFPCLGPYWNKSPGYWVALKDKW